MDQSKEAARDFWAQIFERSAALPNAALHEPDEKAEAAQTEVVVQALREAGWSDAEINRRSEADSFHGDLEDVNSPGVGPGLEFRLKLISDRIRKAIAETGETAQEKVEIGIDPKTGVSAALTNVIMTDQGIISVSAFLFRWCGLVARAYTRTLLDHLAHWTSRAPNPSSDRELLLKNPDLVLYWLRIFVSFSGTGTHILVPFRPSTPREFHLFEQTAWAMEYFTVAHEFGHHVLGHRDVDDDPKTQEFQADAFAAKICARLEYEPFPNLPNGYTRTSAGGSLMLLALEMLRTVGDAGLDDRGADETHPAVNERIERIATRNLMQPTQLEMDKEFNSTVQRVMSAVAAVISEFLDSGGKKLVAEMRQDIREAS